MSKTLKQILAAVGSVVVIYYISANYEYLKKAAK